MKGNLPDRLRSDPLAAMASDSDILVIADTIAERTTLPDEKKQAAALLLGAVLGYLRDWCPPHQRTMENLTLLLRAAVCKDGESPLADRFYEMHTGCKRPRRPTRSSWSATARSLGRTSRLTARNLRRR